MFLFIFIIYTQIIAILGSLINLIIPVDLIWWMDRLFSKSLGINIIEHKKSENLSPLTKVILVNHRSFTDFFIDGYALGRVSYLSRWLVAIICPFAGIYGWLSGKVLFFNRGKTSRHRLAYLIKDHIQARDGVPIIIYPEGHRNTQQHSLVLKHGGLKMCYEEGWPVQLMILTNKEDVIAEKKWHLSFGITCRKIVSKVIYPNNFSDFESFYDHIVADWDHHWDKAYHDKNDQFLPKTIKPPVLKLEFSTRVIYAWGVIIFFILGYYLF